MGVFGPSLLIESTDSMIINTCNFSYLSSRSTSAEDLLIYSRSMYGRDDKTITGQMASKERTVLDAKS